MDLKYSLLNKRIRFHFLWSLIFSFLLLACSGDKKENDPITIQWNGEKAEGITISRNSFKEITEDSIPKLLHVRLSDKTIDVLGEYTINNNLANFKPLISFTPGLKYEVYYSNKLIGEFEIPALNTAITEVLGIYPTTDTLPENALKLYIAFSKPIQEGNALRNITVVKNKIDTISSTFLDLDHELWNKDRTILTLWFDPGRVKRDLQPNKTLGKPLEEGNNYKIFINKEWRDEHGLELKSDYEKNFFVGERDNSSPNPDQWTTNTVKAATRESLVVFLNEPLDYILLKNAIQITDDKDNPITGTIEAIEKETRLNFTPTDAWKPGNYRIEIEGRLEDIAGNNLNRLFDKDLLKPDVRDQKNVYIKKFRVD